MIVAVSRLIADAAVREALESRFAARKKLVDVHPGFRRLQLVKGRGTGEYLLLLEWDDMEAFRSYAKSADFEHAHVELDQGVEAGGLRVYDVVLDSARGD